MDGWMDGWMGTAAQLGDVLLPRAPPVPSDPPRVHGLQPVSSASDRTPFVRGETWSALPPVLEETGVQDSPERKNGPLRIVPTFAFSLDGCRSEWGRICLERQRKHEVVGGWDPGEEHKGDHSRVREALGAPRRGLPVAQGARAQQDRGTRVCRPRRGEGSAGRPRVPARRGGGRAQVPPAALLVDPVHREGKKGAQGRVPGASARRPPSGLTSPPGKGVRVAGPPATPAREEAAPTDSPSFPVPAQGGGPRRGRGGAGVPAAPTHKDAPGGAPPPLAVPSTRLLPLEGRDGRLSPTGRARGGARDPPNRSPWRGAAEGGPRDVGPREEGESDGWGRKAASPHPPGSRRGRGGGTTG